ncbi:MAG TPA: sensor histidine kinase [Candidatus Limnocylindria bacterium]|nr:sensor histidine kinase [Candidatus Limnocylindria bacterium]
MAGATKSLPRLDIGPRRGDLALLTALGIALAAITAYAPFIYAYPLREPLSPLFATAIFAGELLWVAAMLASYHRAPAAPMWKLILTSRAVAALGVLWVVNTPLTWVVWQATIGLATVIFAHLVLAFPSGRLPSRYDRIVVITAYSAFAAARVAWLVVWDPRAATCFPRCQANPFLFWPNEELAYALGPGLGAAMAGLALAVIYGIWRHWHRASPVLRRTLLPVAIVAPLELGLAASSFVLAINQDAWESVGVVISTSPLAFIHAAIPAGFLAGLLAARLSRGGIADLAVQLGRGVPLGGLRDALARAARDPTLALAFPAADGEGYVDPDGRTIDLPAAGDERRGVAPLERDGELLAVLLYDPAIEIEDPGRVAAVGSVAGMALENERLAAQVRAQLEEVRASRARIVEAGDAERRRIERDLHDGAQQRLVALAMRLDQARGTSAGADEVIDATTAELLQAIHEVRDLARGLHPTILTERGLAAAVEVLAERAPVPVRVSVLEERLASEVEAAAYFVIAEALTNAARHARATSVTVVAHVQDGRLVISIADDGQGGADASAGTGLQGLVDRVAAVGGSLAIESTSGEGTVVTAFIPLSGRSR